GEDVHAPARRDGRELTGDTTLADACRTRERHHRSASLKYPLQHAVKGGQFPASADQTCLDAIGPLRLNAEQPPRSYRVIAPFDPDQLGLSENGRTLDQPRRGLAEHH